MPSVSGRALAIALVALTVTSAFAILLRAAVADPLVTDNADGTSTSVWDFNNPADYTLTNASVSGGAGLLGSAGPGVQYWNSTTAGDFAGPDSATNVDFASSPGDVMQAATTGPSTLLSLQPGAGGQDSWLEEINPTNTNGGLTTMTVDGTGLRHRAIMRFDLTTVPAGVVIDSAVLNLYQNGATGDSGIIGSVHEVIANWVENQVTWDDRITGTAWAAPAGGGDYDSHVIAQATLDNTVPVWETWNITQLVDLWYRGVRTNNGLIIVASDTGTSSNKDFRTSDWGTAAQRPRLDIWYRVLGASGEYISKVLGPGSPTAWQTISWNPSVRSLVADEFNGASLDPKWTWLNTPASSDVGTTVPGHLHVVSTANSQIDGPTFTGNALWNDVVGDFSAEMKFSSSPTSSSNRVGLMALLSQRDWFSVGKHYSGGAVNWMTRETVDAGTTTIFNGASGNPIPAWVRLVRTGNTFDAWTSSDGTAWTLRDTYVPSDQYPLSIRLAFYIAHGAAGSGFSADVDYIRVTHGAGATVSVSTRTGDTNPVDGSWIGWSAPYPSSSGSAMAGSSNFIEYRLSFSVSTASPDHRPVVGDVNITSGTTSYVASGTIETNDLVPGDLQAWGTLTVVDAPNGQSVSYEHSLNSGGSWTPVAPPADLSVVSVASGRIRFRVSLSTSDSQVTPTVSEIRLTYTHRLDHFYVTASASAAAGAPFTVTVAAKDATNATIVGWTGTVTLAARLLDGVTPGNGILGTTSLDIIVGGTATLATQTYTRTETIRIHASFGAQEGLSGPVVMSPGPIVRVDVVPPAATILPFGSQSFNATAFDAWDNPVPGAAFTWIVTNGVGTLNTSAGPSVTLTAQPPDGANGTLEATASGVTGVALITVGIPALDHFYVTAPASAAAGAPFSVTVTTKDATNNTIVSWTGTVALAAQLVDGITPGNGILGTTSLAIPAGGTATLATETYTRAETIRIRATFGAATGLSDSLRIVPGPVTRLVVTPDNATLAPLDTQVFSGSAFDAYDNPVPVASFNWSVGGGVGTLNATSGPSVRFTASPPPALGTLQIAFGAVQATATIQVVNGVPPWVAISSPVAGAHVTGLVPIGYANSGDSVTAQFDYDDGSGWSLIGTTAVLNGTFFWDTAALSFVAGSLRATVTDNQAETNTTVVSPIEVDNTPPTILLGGIVDDQATTGTLTIGYATDADVVRVDFTYFDGVWWSAGSDATVDGSYLWSPGVPINGVTLRATAIDEVDLSGADQRAGVGSYVGGSNPPAIAPIPVIHVQAGVPYRLNLTFYVSDPDTALSALNITDSDPANVVVNAGADPSLDILYGSPGAYPVTLWVSDGTDTAWQIVNIIASGQSPPAVAVPLPAASFDEDTTAFDAFGAPLSAFFSDPDLDPLTFAVLDGVFLGSRINANETLDLWAPMNWFGPEVLRIRATDPTGGFAEAAFAVTVRAVNDAPALVSAFPAPTFDEDTTAVDALGGDAALRFADVDGDPVSIAVFGGANVFATVSGGRTVDLWAASNWFGSETLRVRATDPGALFAEGTFLVTVRPVNDAPVAAFPLPPVTYDEDATFVDAFGGPVGPYFLDRDGDVLTFSLLNATQVRFQIHPNGTMDLWAAANWFGNESLWIRGTDPSGEFGEALLIVTVIPVNDAPTLAAIAPVSLEEGQSRSLDLTPFVADIDTSRANLTVTTDSPYVRVNGLVLTMSFPADATDSWFTVTVSDGAAFASRTVRVSVVAPLWRPALLLSAPLAIGLVVGVIARRTRFRPVKAFLVDERKELIREFTLDPTCDLTFEQARAGGALEAVTNAVKIGKYHAQTVRGDALTVALVSYGPVSEDQVEFARQLLLNVQDKFDERIKARLEELRSTASRWAAERAELTAAQTTFETRSRSLGGAFDTIAAAQARVASESEALRAKILDLEYREAMHRQERQSVGEVRDALGAERKDFESLSGRLEDDVKRREAEVATRTAALQEREANLSQQIEEFEGTRAEKTQWIATKDLELEAHAHTLNQREAEIRKQAEENAHRLADLAAREEAIEIDGARLEKARADLEAQRANLPAHVAAIEEKSRQLRELEEVKGKEYRAWSETMESQQAMLREQKEAFEAESRDTRTALSEKRLALFSKEKDLSDREAKARDSVEWALRREDESKAREAAAGEALRAANEMKARVEAGRMENSRRSVELQALERGILADSKRQAEQVARQAEALKAAEAALTDRRSIIEKEFADRDARLRESESNTARMVEELEDRTLVLVRREEQVSTMDATGREKLSMVERAYLELEQRSAKLDEETKAIQAARTDAEAFLENAQKVRSQAEAQQEEVSKTMKFLQRKAVDTIDREEQLRKLEVALEERDKILESRFEIVENKERAMEMERGDMRDKLDRARAEAERLRTQVSQAQHGAAAAAEIEAWNADLENRLKIIQSKAMELLDREEKVRKREEELRQRDERMGVMP